MGTDKALQISQGHVVFVGSKGSGKSSLYQCLKSPNPHVTDGQSCCVLVEDWRPFSKESPVAEECREYFNENLSENDLDASVSVWDICGYEPLWTIQQLCLPETALFVLVFNVRNPRDAGLLPQWVQMIQSKSVGAEIILVASNCEVFEDSCQNVFDEIKKMENRVLKEINEELLILRELQSNIWVKNRIEKLEGMIKKRPNVCPTVYLTSAVTGKGLSDLRRAILRHFFGVEKSSNIHNFNEKELGLMKKLRPLHDGKGIVMSGEDFKTTVSAFGFHDDEELESTTQALIRKGIFSRINIAGSFEEHENTVIITDPCCFAKACAMTHRDENPQDFVSKLQKSTLVQRFWPTSTRPNDWTLRSAIDDVVSRGMIRESFLPLCWQTWNMKEEDIKQLLPAMLKLGVILDGAPKAGYEIELALSYFKNLSVTKRYHLPLLMKLSAEPPAGIWPSVTPSSTVSVDWYFQFQEGFCNDLTLCILAASKNFDRSKIIIAHWQNGLILRLGDVDILLISKPGIYQCCARCTVTNGNKQALHMAWTTLAQFIQIAETYLSNFPGLHYRFGSSSIVNSSSRSVHHLLADHISTSENADQNLWLIPRVDFQKKEELSVPLDLLAWVENLSDQSSVCINYKEGQNEEAQVLGTNLEKCGFNIHLQSSDLASADTEYRVLQRCSAVLILLTKSYTKDPNFEENIKVFEKLSKPAIGVYFEEDINCSLTNTTDLSAGSGTGSGRIFNPEQLQTLINKCRSLIFGTGDIEPLSEGTGDQVSKAIESEPANNIQHRPAESYAPAMETGEPEVNEPKKKHVKFQSDHVSMEDEQIKPLAACTVAAAMVGAAAEHLNLSRKASSAGMRAANATAKVARAVAHGDADGATQALNDVVKIVDGLSNTLKNKEPSAKSKTCVIL